MYNLYQEKWLETEEEPVKNSSFRFIFNTEFNIGLHNQKLIDATCELDKVKMDNEIELTADEVSAQNDHLTEKLATREERKRDKKNENILIVVFDLQNVVTLRKADISRFFYKHKLTMFNLTAKLYEKKGYCCLLV